MKVVCEDGVCMLVEEPSEATPVPIKTESLRPRIAHGYMDADTFIAFLESRNAESASPLAGKSWWLVILLVLFGGICMNLTPCILPMMPINLMIIGRSASRGALYGLGIALAYGTLGILAAAGGMAFGEIQGNPWFNAAIAILFLILALAMLGVFFIDFSKKRNGLTSMRDSMWPGFFAFFMGVVSAVLAGACVAPILIAVLLLTADLFAKGMYIALVLPLILGIGMALPWPFAGAGLQILPKPGAWMTRVNKLFGIIVLGFAAWYGHLAWNGFVNARVESKPIQADTDRHGYISIQSPEKFSLKGLKRPVLVDCWATWCKNCSAMDRTTLSDIKVKATLKSRGFTLVKLQCEDVAALKRLPGFGDVVGLPAFLIFE
jgi:thiol:disulfide interchange protein